jgi:hypothetical protein
MRSLNILHPLRRALAGLVYIPAGYKAPEHILFASCTLSLAHPPPPPPPPPNPPQNMSDCDYKPLPFGATDTLRLTVITVAKYDGIASQPCSGRAGERASAVLHFFDPDLQTNTPCPWNGRSSLPPARECGWNSAGCIRRNDGGHRERCFRTGLTKRGVQKRVTLEVPSTTTSRML